MWIKYELCRKDVEKEEFIILKNLKRWAQTVLDANPSQSKDKSNDALISQIFLSETEEEVQSLKNPLVSKDKSILEQVQRLLSKDEEDLLKNLRALSNLHRIEIHNVMSVFETFIQYRIELHLFDGEIKAHVHTISVFEYHDFFIVSDKACRRRAYHFDLLKSISSIYTYQIKNLYLLGNSKVEIIEQDNPIEDLIRYKEKESLF